MLRRFRERALRQVTELAGFWDFAFLGDVDLDSVEVAAIRFDDRMAVPGCFDATPRYAGRRGLVAYRTRAGVSDATPHRLVLDGVHHWCRIFVDGKPVCDHAGGFTRFSADFTPRSAGEIVIVVLVDNRFDSQRSPLHLEYYDWYHFGGIARGAELHRLGDLWIDALRVVTVDLASRRVKLSLDYSGLERRGPTELLIRCNGQPVLKETLALGQTSGTIERTLELKGAALWSPSEPNLHRLSVRLGDDDQCERIGLRQVALDGRRILVNGEPVRLLGFCRHEAHPQFGHTQPEQLLVSDVQQLLDLGCNFVRGSHYPQDLRFLDLCDEAGLCVWSESSGWGNTRQQLQDPHFVQAELTTIDEMVAAAFNRPSVILWGAINEAETNDKRSRPAFEAFLGRLRQLDPSRPVTYACNHPFDDVCLDLVDVVSINCYPGWYHGEIDEIAAHLDSIAAHLEAVGLGDRPLIISEIGAGAIPGCRDWNEQRWTEQYQAKLLDVVIRSLFIERDRACGLSIWQFCDLRTSEMVQRVLGRPRGFNNKGIVDEYRRPKLAYEIVKRHYHALRGKLA